MDKDTLKQINADDDVTKTDGSLIFNPFNPNNRDISMEEVHGILNSYGVPGMVYNIDLYRRAFVHRSYTKRPHLENVSQNIVVVDRPEDCMALRTKSNERLEFLGDGVLELITKYILYSRFPGCDEGFMTEKKIAIVKNEAIGKIAYEMGLHKWLIISKSAEEKKTRTNLKKLGCLFESFIGALFLDFNKIDVKDENGWFKNVFRTGPGFQMAQIFVENIFERHIDWVKLIENDDNYKNILQVKIQKEFKVTPHYIELKADPETGYTMGVYLCVGDHIYNMDMSQQLTYDHFGSFSKISEYISSNGKVLVFLGQGTHKIKKKAEQIACNVVVNKINGGSSSV